MQVTFSPADNAIDTVVSPASKSESEPIVTVDNVAPEQTMFVNTQPDGIVISSAP